ncbi:MAG: hypothetical protein Q8O15_00870, partial [Rectinemataceae bacterium]|nr:hypothetical protein [Rectinemataceae bacterium]
MEARIPRGNREPGLNAVHGSLTGEIQERIFKRLGDPNTVFVFPSQIAAQSHARAICLSGRVGAVETARFAGWDSFKEALFSPGDSRRPANRISRTIWAARVLERQKKEGFLSVMTGPGEPAQGFLGYIASIPPRLHSTVRAIREDDTSPGIIALAETGTSGMTGESALLC